MRGFDRFHCRRPHIKLHSDIGGNAVHQIAALSDDRVNADDIFFLKRLSQGVNPHDPQACRIQGVNPFVRCIRGVRRPANVTHQLHQEAIARFADCDSFLRHFPLRVHHHRHIDIIEMPFVDKLIFAAKVMKLPLAHQSPAIFDFNVLFRRNGKEHDVAGQLRQNPALYETFRRRQHRRHLEKMAASMRRSRQRIGLRAVRRSYGIQLT